VSLDAWTNPISRTTQTGVTASGTLSPGAVSVRVFVYDNSVSHNVGPFAAVVTGSTWAIPPSDVSALDNGIVIYHVQESDAGNVIVGEGFRGAIKSTSGGGNMAVQAVSSALVATLPGNLHKYDYGPDLPIGPAAYCYPSDLLYDIDGQGDVTGTWIIRFLIPSAAAKGGQAQLNALLSTSGAGSAVAALQADNTLTGLIQSLKVQRMRNNGVLKLGEPATRFYSAELVCEVFA
jgi:hypothetical protein